MNRSEDRAIMRVIGKLAKSKVSEIMIGKLEQVAAKMGVDEKELFQLYVETKNKTSR